MLLTLVFDFGFQTKSGPPPDDTVNVSLPACGVVTTKRRKRRGTYSRPIPPLVVHLGVMELVCCPPRLVRRRSTLDFRHLPSLDKPVSYTHLRAHETRHDLVC